MLSMAHYDLALMESRMRRKQASERAALLSHYMLSDSQASGPQTDVVQRLRRRSRRGMQVILRVRLHDPADPQTSPDESRAA
jgi:hypothetical protein